MSYLAAYEFRYFGVFWLILPVAKLVEFDRIWVTDEALYMHTHGGLNSPDNLNSVAEGGNAALYGPDFCNRPNLSDRPPHRIRIYVY